ncbi:MAG: zinc-binding alcohol dehydrogenase [Kiritimatiellae bacterium]|nr:zinc-binding alcohol dehydrogenase [Kiritimatiellia bacterium]
MKRRRLVAVAKGELELQESEIPEFADGKVLIETIVTLISPGTERAFLLGMANTPGGFPRGTGYNNVGRIVRVGRGVDGFKEGDVVVGGGGHASHLVADPKHLHHVPAGVSPEHAVFLVMGVIALQGVRKAGIELGESVLTIGAGLLGQLAMQLARLHGGVPVIAMDLSAPRLATARACGADATLDARDLKFSETLAGLTNGDGPAVVLEVTGAPEPVNTVLQLAGRGGRVVLLACTRGETEKVNFYRDVEVKGLTVVGAYNPLRPARDSSRGSWTARDDARTVLTLLEKGRLTLEPLISHRIAAADLVKAYDELVFSGSEELMGGLIQWL